MRNLTRTTVVVAGLALMAASAPADSFIVPPETNAPQWHTSAPYQRNINMGFAVSPASAPGSGIPGAVYEGSLDPSLASSDFVTFGGSASWYGPLAGIGTGLIGIDNRAGTEMVAGTVTLHIANTAQSGGVHNLWSEAIAITSYNGASSSYSVFDPLSVAATNLGGSVNSYGSAWLSDYEFQIAPSPAYETIVWYFEAPAGTYIFTDNLHLATEYFPEPAALSLLAMATPALLWRRRRNGGKR